MTRRELREHTFKQIFLSDFYPPDDLPEQFRLYMRELNQLEEESKSLILQKTEQVAEARQELDSRINLVAEGWKTTRMGKVDRAIIRLALYEILYDDSIPNKVAINEAVEIAKKYGGDESPAFVNGILAKLVPRRQDAPEEDARRGFNGAGE
jgi:N utilization substance protein B